MGEPAKMIVQLTTDDLRSLVATAVREALGSSSPGGAELEYLTLDQVADLLQACPRTVKNWTKQKALPFLRVGAEWRFRRADVIAWLDQQAVTSGAHVTKHVGRLGRLKQA